MSKEAWFLVLGLMACSPGICGVGGGATTLAGDRGFVHPCWYIVGADPSGPGGGGKRAGRWARCLSRKGGGEEIRMGTAGDGAGKMFTKWRRGRYEGNEKGLIN